MNNPLAWGYSPATLFVQTASGMFQEWRYRRSNPAHRHYDTAHEQIRTWVLHEDQNQMVNNARALMTVIDVLRPVIFVIDPVLSSDGTPRFSCRLEMEAMKLYMFLDYIVVSRGESCNPSKMKPEHVIPLPNDRYRHEPYTDPGMTIYPPRADMYRQW